MGDDVRETLSVERLCSVRGFVRGWIRQPASRVHVQHVIAGRAAGKCGESLQAAKLQYCALGGSN